MAVKVSRDIVSATDFKAHLPDHFRRAAKTGQPVVVTQNGKAAGVMLSPAEYDRLTELEQVLSVVKRGMVEAKAGRGFTPEEVLAKMQARFGRSKSK